MENAQQTADVQAQPVPAQVQAPDLAMQILQRLEAVETENRNLRGQLASAQVPPPPAPHPVPRPQQATIDTRVLGKPINGVKDDHAWPETLEGLSGSARW